MEEIKREGNNELPKPSVIKTITSPISNFMMIRENPLILKPFLVIIPLLILGSLLMAFSIDSDLIFQNQEIPEGTEDFLMTFTTVSAAIGGIVTPIIYLFLSTGVLLLASKFTETEVNFKQILSMNLHILLLLCISLIVNGLLKISFDFSTPYYLTSLSSIIPNSNIQAIVANIEFFTILHVILRAIGLQYVAKFPKWLAWLSAIAIFMILLIVGAMNSLMATMS